MVSTGNRRVLWIVAGLGRDAGKECGVGAELVALVVNVLCSTVLVVPICVHLCDKVPCGATLGDRDGSEGAETLVAVRLIPVGCFLEWSLGSKVISPVDGHSGSLSIGQKSWL